MKLRTVLAATALATLAACGGGTQQEQAAEQLENAAEQSDPAAAQALENASDQVESGNLSAQEALQQAGNAQAATVPTGQTPPPSMQAQPNRTGQQTPPPKVRTPPAEGNSQ